MLVTDAHEPLVLYAKHATKQSSFVFPARGATWATWGNSKRGRLVLTWATATLTREWDAQDFQKGSARPADETNDLQ